MKFWKDYTKLWNKDVVVIILAGLFIRFLILPYTQTVHADAISRIFHAEQWLSNPTYILSDVWGPLNQYLYGLSIYIGGKIYGPKILNILLASFTVYPLYWFTRNIFNTRNGSILVASIYILSPLVIRNSFQALPAVPFAFFLALSMYYLSVYTTKNKSNYIIFSAIAINLAGALRYEAWIISFLFGIILLLHKKYRAFFIFGVIAIIFPISWLVGGKIVHNDWLYSFHYSTDWALHEVPNINDITRVDLLKRILFFPYSVFIVFNPFVFVMILFSTLSSFIKKRAPLTLLIWIIPAIVLFGIYSYKAISGTLFLQHKYTISILVLLLPFVSLSFIKTSKIVKTVSILSVLLIIPLSLILDKVPWKKGLRFSSTLSLAVNDLFIDSYNETKPIPRLQEQEFLLMVDLAQQESKSGDGLILDFLGWEKSYYLALHHKNPAFMVAGASHQKINFNNLSTYINKHPNGLFFLDYLGRFYPFCEGNETMIKINNIEKPIIVELIRQHNSILMFKYNSKIDSIPFIKSEKSVLSLKKDVDFFINRIKRDKYWLKTIENQAKEEDKDFEELLRDNAQYCVDMGY